MTPIPDPDSCYRAVAGRDPRFDGWFFTAVRTTRIYCRPSCPAQTPRRVNVTFYPSAAAAQRAGYRACKRCRPDAAPGSPDWDTRGDLAGRALRLIGDGVIDREGVSGLATRLGYSERQLNRTLLAEVGAGPLALARSQRAQTARVLLETTDLPAGEVAFAAGFASVRQFNDTVRAVFATTPTGLRARRRSDPAEAGTIRLRLAYRPPLDVAATLDYLAARAVTGVETVVDGAYTRVIAAPGGPALARVQAGGSGPALVAAVRLSDQRDLVFVVARLRRLFDLDADPAAVESVLGADADLGPLVDRYPGRRSPGTVDGFELAVRAIVGQQVSVSGARTVLSRIVAEHGAIAFTGQPWRVFPGPEALLAADGLPLPQARQRTIRALAEAWLAGRLSLDPGAERERERDTLLGLPGIGPWTADYIRLRALGDPDVLLAGDLGVRRSAARLGVELAGERPEWAPWRSYATQLLWAAEH